MDEPGQSFNPGGIIPKEQILALSWNIATEPKLYRELAPNPYSPRSLQIISERFPGSNTAEVIRAVVLAEPEGEYDRNFSQLPKAQQEEELSKQRDILTEINKRLVHRCEKYANEFSQLPKEFVYACLSIVVFETADLNEIEQKYSQNLRRHFRLSIVDFIEDAQKLTSYRQQKDDDNLPAIGASGVKPVPGRPLLKIVPAALSLILFFYLAIGLYEKQVDQRQAQSTTQHSEVEKQILGIKAQKESQELPVRLIIPAINVDASIQYIGVTQSGEMAVPSNTVDVGWFNLGPRPGERGSAVIAGHFNGENSEAGVFADLYKLKEGDKLYIEDDRGTIISFVVRESRTYDPGYADEVFNSSDGAHLNLITCDGVWDGIKKSYSKRMVIFADITQ